MTRAEKHKWTFTSRFRRHAFGWRSQVAVQRVKEAVTEIKSVARKDPVSGAEGAVLFLEKVSPALAHVDSSSGAIGTAVNNAVEILASIIARAPVAENARRKWLDRLWKAIEEDDIPYIELLPEYWGKLCQTPELASNWADELKTPVHVTWSESRRMIGSYFKGTPACLSALFSAGRHEELLELLDLAPHRFWHERKWGVKALVAMGRKAEALRYAEESGGLNESPTAIAAACEEILLSSGLVDEAYQRYAIAANQKTTYLATFRAIANKYPGKAAHAILSDLVASTPGNEGKWFAAAKSAGLYREAIDLANRTPCDPKTLTRAARDMRHADPRFALEAGIAALRWLIAGYGYEITARDVREAYEFSVEAAINAGCRGEILARIRALVENDVSGDRFVAKILGPKLDVLGD